MIQEKNFEKYPMSCSRKPENKADQIRLSTLEWSEIMLNISNFFHST